MRPTLHVTPRGAVETTRHYIRDIVYGASDGIVTTFAVVSGVAGGSLSHLAVLVIGVANLAADGLSMGVGNLTAIRAEERAREASGLPELERYPWKHGMATLVSFVVAGSIPLLPFVLPIDADARLFWSACATFVTMFALGAARSLVTNEQWWRSGLETLGLGALVAVTAYGAGVLVAHLAGGL